MQKGMGDWRRKEITGERISEGVSQIRRRIKWENVRE